MQLRSLRAARAGLDPSFSERLAIARQAADARAGARNQLIFFGLFLFLVFMSVALVRLSIAGLPIRGMYGIVLGSLLALTQPQAFAEAVRKHTNTLGVIVVFALLGAGSSFLSNAGAAVIGRQLMEIHLQALVNLIVAATILEVCGPKALLKAFLIVIAITSFVAILQGLGVGFAWKLQSIFGKQMDIDALDQDGRASGISLSKVILGTQVCLAFAMLYMYRAYDAAAKGIKAIDPVIGIAVVAFIAVCVAGGNRSPLLGMAIFILLYATLRLGPVALVGGVVAAGLIPLVPIVLAHMQGSEVRVLRIGDKSSSGRWPLIVYGVRLFLDQPMGYGLGFDPTQHWAKHWSAMAHIFHADIIQTTPLHNYVLNILNKYGFGVFFVAPVTAILMSRHKIVLLGFVPYAAHILFHNDGPFTADFMFWFVIALSSMGIEPRQHRSPRRGFGFPLGRNRTRHAPAAIGPGFETSGPDHVG